MNNAPEFSLSYVEVATLLYPHIKFVAYGTNYADIEWHGTASVPKAELDSAYIRFLRKKYTDWVKKESVVIREEASLQVIGTNDTSMIRVYDLKKVQAKEFMLAYESGTEPEASTYSTLSSALPVADQDVLRSKYAVAYEEAEGTGATLWQMCWAILDQFRLSAIVLEPVLGQIEAERRIKTYEYKAASDEASIRAITAPNWPDISLLQEI